MKTWRCNLAVFSAALLLAILVSGCAAPKEAVPAAISPENATPAATSPELKVPKAERWGIYGLGLDSGETRLVYSTQDKISGLRLSNRGGKFAFSQQMGGVGDEFEEIASLNADGTGFTRLTRNSLMDAYPAWSPDDARIAYLSLRGDLDIRVMNADASGDRELFDSGSHDADVHWVGGKLVFTSNSSVWIMNDDGTGPAKVTSPPRAGEWGNANLPFGDYDPRLSPDGTRIVFERLENDASPHGNYDLFVVNADGSGEARLTQTGYSQGLASWSNSGDLIVYIVAAVGSEGKYDIHVMNADGTGDRNVMPAYAPPNFLAHSAVFSQDDSKIYFIGEWWE